MGELKKSSSALVDPFGRQITYLRLSVTDRCDLRCHYCMPQKMTFLPKSDLLTLEELESVARGFVELGVKKIRLTGGEPLVRKNVGQLISRLGAFVHTGLLEELTLTTNGNFLPAFVPILIEAGVKRVNISLDSLDPKIYSEITRGGDLSKVLVAVDTALAAGLKVKINIVVLKNENMHDIATMINWAHEKKCDVSLIEVMPVGETEKDRFEHFVSLQDIKAELAHYWTLLPSMKTTSGPSRYMHVKETGGLVGFISPLSQNFCDNCNRVRVTCTGQLYPCLGQNDQINLRSALRNVKSESDKIEAIKAALVNAISIKPKRHDFEISSQGQKPYVQRHMSVTGG